ncbi:ThiJ/PfpI [Ephemerocybe angulata]|uniref:ThiJ/PfpI n=1 Tax=Ephemerocybe angulata TaxID=980116 RepID=A0A8H6MGR6_9AGAR|nr:ThiJ/PfpI [Tulosesus angulatus]
MKYSVLFVFTSVDKALSGHQTGWCLAEAAHPYYVLAPHASIDFASPAGPNPPVDEESTHQFMDDLCQGFLKDETVKQKLATAMKLSEVDPADYDAVFYPGGDGAVNAKLVSEFWRMGKIVSAVGHWSRVSDSPLPGLMQGTDAKGNLFLSGRTVTALSDVEEEISKKTKDLPWLIEDKLREDIGAKYHKVHVHDPNIVNPASAEGVGQAVVTLLKQLD